MDTAVGITRNYLKYISSIKYHILAIKIFLKNNMLTISVEKV